MGENRFQKIDEDLLTPEAQAKEHEVYETSSPEDAAAYIFMTYWPQYQSLVEKLPKKEAIKLLKALPSVPLNDEPIKFHTDQAKVAFLLGRKLMQANWAMQLHTLAEIEKKKTEPKDPPQPAPEGSIPLSEFKKNVGPEG